MASSRFRIITTLMLVAAAAMLGLAGRFILDHLIALAPGWAPGIERVGGWLVGMVIVLVVLFPLLHMYGVFDSTARSSKPEAKGGDTNGRES